MTGHYILTALIFFGLEAPASANPLPNPPIKYSHNVVCYSLVGVSNTSLVGGFNPITLNPSEKRIKLQASS